MGHLGDRRHRHGQRADPADRALVAILYAQGEIAARGALAFGFRLGGERGMEVMRLAAQAVRSVALGVVVTALVQSVLDRASPCGSAEFQARAYSPHWSSCWASRNSVRCPSWCPRSPGCTGPTRPCGERCCWCSRFPSATLDNVLRPILIRRGVQLPMLLIIARRHRRLDQLRRHGPVRRAGDPGRQLHAGEVLGGRRQRTAGRCRPPRHRGRHEVFHQLAAGVHPDLAGGGTRRPLAAAGRFSFAPRWPSFPSPRSSCARPGSSPPTPVTRSADC